MQMAGAGGNVVPAIATATEAAVMDAPPGEGVVGTIRGGEVLVGPVQ